MATKVSQGLNQRDLEKYVGLYASSEDFLFQEQMRKVDLAVKSLIQNSLGSSKAEPFFVNGWGQIIGAAFLLEKKEFQISQPFIEFLKDGLAKAIAKGKEVANPFSLNVRGFTKPLMMHPTHPTHAGKYFDWKRVEIEKPIIYLNQFVREADLGFSLHEGKVYLKINPEDESNIFNKLWKTEFASLLQENEYVGFEKNKECPHITLVNSDIVAKVREAFIKKYEDGQQRFEAFFTKILEQLNQGLKEQVNPVQFTELSSTYSDDYSPFEEAIVAKLEAPYVEQALTRLLNEMEQVLKELLSEKEKEAGKFRLPIKSKYSFHLTIATKYRVPSTSLSESIETVIHETGEYSDILNSFLKMFEKV